MVGGYPEARRVSEEEQQDDRLQGLHAPCVFSRPRLHIRPASVVVFLFVVSLAFVSFFYVFCFSMSYLCFKISRACCSYNLFMLNDVLNVFLNDCASIS